MTDRHDARSPTDGVLGNDERRLGRGPMLPGTRREHG